jgi:beta-lactam-binding protein with PASTA domain
MGERLPSFLPRIAVVVLVVLAATAGLTFAAGQQIASTPAAAPAAKPEAKTLVVPDLRNQAFVFAKGQLQDLGFAWRVAGAVQGYAANTVVSQSPAPGTKLLDTGAPLVVVTLARNRTYPQAGTPADASPYTATPLRLADAAVAAAPALPRTPASKAATPKPAAAKPAAAPRQRPPDFVVPGARKEPADEVALPVRASALGTWLAAHPKRTNANVRHWLYQNEWIVAGARMGWWHGAQALRTLIAVDQRTMRLWGIGDRSGALARRALAEVEARSS